MINSFVIENITNGVSVNMGGTGMVQMVSGYWESGQATNLSGAVLLTGNQSISGNKVFSNDITTSGTLNVDNLVYLDKVIGVIEAGRIRIYNSSTGELLLSSSNDGNPIIYGVYSGNGYTLVPLQITANPLLLNPVVGYGGNVGIGTLSPQSLLDVSGTILAGAMRISGSSVVLQSQIGDYYPRYSNPEGYVKASTIPQGAVASVGGLTYVIGTTGYGNVTVTTGTINGEPTLMFSGATGTLADASSLSSTGSNLQSQINSINNNTGVFISTGQTGVFYPRTNPSGFVRDTQTGSFITSGQTGIFVVTGDTGRFITTGQTGQFSWTGHTHVQYVNTGNTGIFITTGQTGVFYPRSNPSGFIGTLQTGQFATTGNLNTTGQFLSEWISSVESTLGDYATTAYVSTNYVSYTEGDNRYALYVHAASTGALDATGQLLQSQIDALSGKLISTGNSLQSQINIVSGLSLTGIRAPIITAGQVGTNYIMNWSLSDSFQYSFVRDTSKNPAVVAWVPQIMMTGFSPGQIVHCLFINTGLTWEGADNAFSWNGYDGSLKVYIPGGNLGEMPECLASAAGTPTAKHSDLYQFIYIGGKIYGKDIALNLYDDTET